MTGYIADGYTRSDGYIASPPPGPNGEVLWDALEFTYRPATRMEVIILDSENDVLLANRYTDLTAVRRAEEKTCEFVAARVKSWNLKAVGVHNVAITAKELGKLNYLLFQKLYTIIRGSSTSDPKPPSDETPPSDEDQQKNSERVSGSC